MSFYFSPGARGFIIRRLQEALGVAADGVFGSQTQKALLELQRKHAVRATGKAEPQNFISAGIEWPSEFERAMNLVSNFEGTSFGDCNSLDIDGAGLTLGIAGFTTAHGEVQQLLARYISAQPRSIDQLHSNLRNRLTECLMLKAGPVQWRKAFYGSNGSVIKEWRAAFASWGQCAVMQQLQLGMAEKQFWIPAVATAESLGFQSLRARIFFLDVAVQNGGWRHEHLVTARQMPDWHSGDEQKALTVGARAVASCAKEEWRNDVLSRKMALATGRGVVHGRDWKLTTHALG